MGSFFSETRGSGGKRIRNSCLESTRNDQFRIPKRKKLIAKWGKSLQGGHKKDAKDTKGCGLNIKKPNSWKRENVVERKSLIMREGVWKSLGWGNQGADAFVEEGERKKKVFSLQKEKSTDLGEGRRGFVKYKL